VLVGSKGTIVIKVEAVVVWLRPCTVAFEAGSWQIFDGSRAYERLKGGGAGARTADSLGDVCAGAIPSRIAVWPMPTDGESDRSKPVPPRRWRCV
jgi:hypothetical protein